MTKGIEMGCLATLPDHQYRDPVGQADYHIPAVVVETTQYALPVSARCIDHAHTIGSYGDYRCADITLDAHLSSLLAVGRVGVVGDQLVAVKYLHLLRGVMQMTAAQPEATTDSR
ncbi:MAG: hypothetical protein Q9M13_04835 [Mariprofundales bacterium]|nr:hypothetical protein [Mariprofundales bacterium]